MVSRSLKVDLYLGEEQTEHRRQIISSIRRYRHTARTCFSILACAQAAGSSIIWKDDDIQIKPDNAKAKQLLELATGKEGKVLIYELRNYILRDLNPTWMSFVFDSVRRDIEVAWKAKDPEFTRASRGWLILQGSRGITQFNRRGIGFPVKTAKPKLDKHSLTLKWDHDLGPIEFKLGKLDGGRYYVWKSLRDGCDGFELGTLYLTEIDGKLAATLTYSKPPDVQEVDVGRMATLEVFGNDPERLMVLQGPDGEETLDRIDSQETHAWLSRMHMRKKVLEARRAACGSPRRPWGHRKGWLAAQDVLSNLTKLRTNGVTERNHRTTARMLDRLVKWRCGTVRIAPLPELIAGFQWNWSQFRQFVEYKLSEASITVVWEQAE